MSTATLACSAPIPPAIRQLFANWSAARQPAPARPLSRREEADQLRDVVEDIAQGDARFALDLYAAADRHERG